MAANGWNWSNDVWEAGQGEASDMTAESNPVADFVRNRIALAGPEAERVSSSDIYSAFTAHAAHRFPGLKRIPHAPEAIREIVATVKALGGDPELCRSNGKRYWRGFAILPP